MQAVAEIPEIAEFIRLTRGLSTDTLAKAIRRRWPEAGEREIREALRVAETDAVAKSTWK